jgi:hypothetical protein
MTTTPDFEKMFEIENILNSEDQTRYINAVRRFGNAVAGVLDTLGVDRDDPRCVTLVAIAEDMLQARRDAELEAMRAGEEMNKLSARITAATRFMEQKGEEAGEAFVRKHMERFSTTLLLSFFGALLMGVLGFVAGWGAHEMQRPRWEPPQAQWYPPRVVVAPPIAQPEQPQPHAARR